MPFEQYANEAATTLNGAVTAGQTTITVTSASGFPPSGIFRIRVSGTLTAGGTGVEYMTVTQGGAGVTTWTVVRGAEAPYSTGLGFATGATVEQVVTVKAMVNSQLYDVRAYGARLDVVTRADAAMTSGSATVTSAGASFNAQDVGKVIQVSGAGASGNPLYGTISSVTDATHVVASVTASTTVSGATLKYGSDDTTALTAAIADVNSVGGGVLFLPAGESWTGQLTLYSRVHLQGSGIKTTVLILKPGMNVDLLRGDQYATLAHTNSGAGILQFSVRNVTLDGNRLAQNLPLATPAAPTVAGSTTGGTMAAATYNVKIARLNANGATLNSAASTNVVTTGSTSSITVTFPATVTNQTGWRVLVNPGGTYGKWADVGLIASTVITSTTTSAYDLRSADDAGRCFAVYGYDYVVDNIVCRFSAGDNFYSEWGNTDTMADSNNDWMESFVSNIKCRDGGASGFVWNGPHDSVVSNVISAFNSNSAPNTYDGIACLGNGYTTLFNTCHAFGNHAYAWHTQGNFFLNNCVGEGASVAELYVEGDSVVVNSGIYFGFGSGTGIRIGTPGGYSPLNSLIVDAKITGFTTGTALDITNAGANTKITTTISQVSGTALTGTVPADAELDIHVYGGSTTPSIQQIKGRLGGTTTPAVTAAAGANAGTSPPAPVVTGATDLRGTITFGTGSGTPAVGVYATVTFASAAAFPRAPVVVLVPANSATAVKQPYVGTVTTTTFQIGLGVAGAVSQANTVYAVNYMVLF